MKNMHFDRTDRMPERTFIIISMTAIALFHIILGVQGFDMCDEGWVLSGFQQIFNDSKSIQYLFLYYLSEYVGGVWDVLWGGCGIFGFRILTAICITLSSYFVYKMLRPIVNRWCILAGLFLVYLCAGYGVMVFYHDYLTTLLSVGASSCMLKSLLRSDRKWIFASGIIIGINVFARLPNLSLSLLILCLIPYHIYKRDMTDTLRMLTSGVLGFAVGVVAVILLMLFSGHYDIFTQAITDGMSAAGDSQSTHNISEMFGRYLLGYARVAQNALLIMLVPALIWICRRKTIKKKSNLFLIGIIAAGIYLAMLKFCGSNTSILYAASTICCLGILLSKPRHNEYVYLAFIVLINMYALPLGSDYGIENMGEYCVYISGPLTVGMAWKWWEKHRSINRDTRILLAVCAVTFIMFVARRGVFNIMSQCYFDEGFRWNKTELIDNPRATTFTTKKNCEQLNPMLNELGKYVKEDDYLLCFQNIATVHFLTRTRPYLYNPWVWTYDPSNMERKFREAEAEHKELPVVVRDKSMLPKWYEYYPDWNNENAEESYTHKNRKIILINRFLTRNGYKVVWENEVFQILLPPQKTVLAE